MSEGLGRVLYRKVGRKYVPVGTEMLGMLADGLWLVQNKGQSSALIAVPEELKKISLLKLQAMHSHFIECCNALMALRKRGAFSVQEEVEVVFKVLAQRGKEVKRSQGVLEFDLAEERTDFELACKAGALYSVLWDMAEWLRRRYKHEGPRKGINVVGENEETRKAFYEILDEHGVDLDT